MMGRTLLMWNTQFQGPSRSRCLLVDVQRIDKKELQEGVQQRLNLVTSKKCKNRHQSF